jgi:hypothetical protein
VERYRAHPPARREKMNPSTERNERQLLVGVLDLTEGIAPQP